MTELAAAGAGLPGQLDHYTLTGLYWHRRLIADRQAERVAAVIASAVRGVTRG